jgi:hypothetical protein
MVELLSISKGDFGGGFVGPFFQGRRAFKPSASRTRQRQGCSYLERTQIKFMEAKVIQPL